MESSWLCRDYQKGDEHSILMLYQEVNKREMLLSQWLWKFADVPFGHAIIKLMFDGNKLIGHYAVVPLNVQVGGVVVDAALSVNTMTHPDYEKRGIFSYLAEETYKKCRQQGLKFVYGFPNKNSYYGFTRKLGWQDLDGMTILEKELKVPAQTETSRWDAISPVDRFDERIDSLWGMVRADYSVIVSRTSKYLNWRFVEHPVEKYARFVIGGNNTSLLGYLVLKTYYSDQGIKGHIVDVLCSKDKDLVRNLIRYSEQHFMKIGITNLSCWASERSLYGEVLAEEGFKRKEFGIHFGVRAFDKRDKTLVSLAQKENWHLAMGDLDVV